MPYWVRHRPAALIGSAIRSFFSYSDRVTVRPSQQAAPDGQTSSGTFAAHVLRALGIGKKAGDGMTVAQIFGGRIVLAAGAFCLGTAGVEVAPFWGGNGAGDITC